MTPEAALMQGVMLALGCEHDLTLWRNNVGVAEWRNGARTRYGLAPGSADLIGVLAPGRFFALELKSAKGRLTADQAHWLAHVRKRGGFAAVVRSTDDARAALARARAGAVE